MKLPVHPVRTGTGTAGLPGKVISIYIAPLNPAYPARRDGTLSGQNITHYR
jgi:hypothetical protein